MRQPHLKIRQRSVGCRRVVKGHRKPRAGSRFPCVSRLRTVRGPLSRRPAPLPALPPCRPRQHRVPSSDTLFLLGILLPLPLIVENFQHLSKWRERENEAPCTPLPHPVPTATGSRPVSLHPSPRPLPYPSVSSSGKPKEHSAHSHVLWKIFFYLLSCIFSYFIFSLKINFRDN